MALPDRTGFPPGFEVRFQGYHYPARMYFWEQPRVDAVQSRPEPTEWR